MTEWCGQAGTRQGGYLTVSLSEWQAVEVTDSITIWLPACLSVWMTDRLSEWHRVWEREREREREKESRMTSSQLKNDTKLITVKVKVRVKVAKEIIRWSDYRDPDPANQMISDQSDISLGQLCPSARTWSNKTMILKNWIISRRRWHQKWYKMKNYEVKYDEIDFMYWFETEIYFHFLHSIFYYFIILLFYYFTLLFLIFLFFINFFGVLLTFRITINLLFILFFLLKF